MAVHELLGCEEWLYTTLSTDAALGSVVSTRVYSAPAPQNAAYPFVSFAQVSAADDNLVAGGRACVEVTYQVEVVSEGASFGPLRAAANRIDAILHGAHGTATAGSVTIASTRDEPYKETEIVNGVRYNHLGGVYRLYAGSQG
jgi:hypothetical protein